MKIMKKIVVLFLVAGLCFPLLACTKTSTETDIPVDQKERYQFTDDLGRSVTVGKVQRVVAMTGSFAQIWCLAGGKDCLVAAPSDTWTAFSLDLSEEVVNIGAVKEPSLEILLSVKPDFILASCNTTANMEMKDTLEKAGIPTAFFDIQHIDDYLNMLQICVQITGCEENYQRYGLDVKSQVETAIQKVDGSAPRILCMRATGSSCKVKGSVDFLLGEMLADLGCINIADSETQLLEELSLESIMKADPEYIFVVLQGSDPTRAAETLEKTLLSNPAWQQLSAVKNGKFFTLEHELFNIKPNDRWGIAYDKLAKILYPDE